VSINSLPTAIGSVSAIIVTYNSAEHIAECLDALERAGVGNVIVVDNASADDSVELIRRHSLRARLLVSEGNLGFGRAVNRGAAEAGVGHDLLLVNPDCLVTGTALEQLRRRISSRPELGICGPAMMYVDGTRGIAGGSFPSLTKELLAATGLRRLLAHGWERKLAQMTGTLLRPLTGYLASVHATEPIELDWVSGFCMYVRREAWDGAGGFDPRFFMYFEDVALCRAVRRAGWSVECMASVTAVHSEGASSSEEGKHSLYRDGRRTYFRLYGTALQRGVARVLGWGRW
jgi:GT2 family glycosyltransferase